MGREGRLPRPQDSFTGKKKPTCIPRGYCYPVKTYPWAAVTFRVKKIRFLNNPRMKNKARKGPHAMLSCLSLEETGILMIRSWEWTTVRPGSAKAWSQATLVPSHRLRRHEKNLARCSVKRWHLITSSVIHCFVSWTVWDSTCKLIMQPKGKM